MNQTADILTELERRGISIRLDGDELCLRPKLALDKQLLDRIRKAKPAILELLRNGSTKPHTDGFWGHHGDSYGWRLNAAIELIKATPNYPEGVVRWLETGAPYLYDQLTRALPDRISQGWEARIPFDDFDALCLELEDAHTRAVALYRQHLSHERRDEEVLQ